MLREREYRFTDITRFWESVHEKNIYDTHISRCFLGKHLCFPLQSQCFLSWRWEKHEDSRLNKRELFPRDQTLHALLYTQRTKSIEFSVTSRGLTANFMEGACGLNQTTGFSHVLIMNKSWTLMALSNCNPLGITWLQISQSQVWLAQGNHGL